MSKGKRTVYCTGGSTTIPCPHNGWVKLYVIGVSDTDHIVCGKHYRTVSVAMLKAHSGSILGVQEV